MTDNLKLHNFAPQLAAILLYLLAAACGPTTPQATPVPTTPPLVGSVEIDYPQDGTIVYSEVLYVAGRAEGVPDSRFTIRLLGAEDEQATQAAAQVDAEGRWTLELVHGYSGEPAEMTLLALPSYSGAPPGVDYAVKSIVVAGNAYRPEGVFGSITQPQEGGSVGGDFIQVSGSVSGVFENQFAVALLKEDGSVIDQTPVLANNPYYVDEVPWTAELMTDGYTGPAEIRAFALSPKDGREIPLGSVRVIITQVAG